MTVELWGQVRRRPVRVGLVSLAVLALSTAGCGSAPTAPQDAPAGEIGERLRVLAAEPSAERNQQLAEMARGAGPVLVYSSNPPEEFKRITDAFTDTYGIEIENYRAGETDLVQRVVQETQAKARTADVISANDNVIYALDAGEGLLRPFVADQAAKLPDELRVSKNSHPVYVNYWMWAYNTDLLSKEELPHTYEDLLDPRWAGKFTVARYPDWLATMFEVLDDPERYFTSLREQKPLVANQFTPAILPVVSGEYELTITTTSGVLANQQADGAPLAGYFPDDPTPARSQSVGWLKGGSNPAGGLLFAEFLLSPKHGQRFMREANRVPAHEDVPPDPRELRPDNFVTVDYEAYLPKQSEWERRFDDLRVAR